MANNDTLIYISLFEIPQRAAEPYRHDELGHSYDYGTDIQVVAVHRDVAHHHVEDQQDDDESLHEGIRHYTKH